MWEASVTILVGAILIFFIILILKPVPEREKRKDDRDAKKSSDMDEPGGWTRETQQPAELQVGEKREKVELSRFEPNARRR
jgi:hypothetical protein